MRKSQVSAAGTKVRALWAIGRHLTFTLNEPYEKLLRRAVARFK